jgi:hypothetical protein
MATIKVDWTQYTQKQKDAISGYIRHGNKMKAYRESYDVTTMTDKTWKRACYKFFVMPKIKAIIDQVHEQAVARANIQIEEAMAGFCDDLVQQATEEELLKIDAFWVLKRAALLADFNIRKFIKQDDNGNAVYNFSEATDDDWYCIQEYTTEEIARGSDEDQYFVDKLKIKSYDKLRALELVGKHIDVQAFKDKVEHLGQIGIMIAPDEDGL